MAKDEQKQWLISSGSPYKNQYIYSELWQLIIAVMDRKCVLKENSCCRGLEKKKGLDGQRRKTENVSGKILLDDNQHDLL